jgi:hypothetical protein
MGMPGLLDVPVLDGGGFGGLFDGGVIGIGNGNDDGRMIGGKVGIGEVVDGGEVGVVGGVVGVVGGEVGVVGGGGDVLLGFVLGGFDVVVGRVGGLVVVAGAVGSTAPVLGGCGSDGSVTAGGGAGGCGSVCSSVRLSSCAMYTPPTAAPAIPAASSRMSSSEAPLFSGRCGVRRAPRFGPDTVAGIGSIGAVPA